MQILRSTSLLLFRLAVFLRTLYDVIDQQRKWRELVRVLENCREHCDIENPSPTPVGDAIGESNYKWVQMENWIDSVYETLCRKMETKE